MDNNPFVKQQSPIEKLYCTFLEYRPTPESKDLLLSYKTEDEEFVFEESHIYFCYHKGYGKAKVTNPFIEKKLNLQATRSEEHTSELQSRENNVCRLQLEKK